MTTAVASLYPPMPVSLRSKYSNVQLCCSANRWYIRNRSAAKRAASSPPVPAGTGGDEAALFAADLFRMYQRFAEQHNWTFEYLDLNETGMGGYKEATAVVTGKSVFSKLKFESGVHRDAPQIQISA